MSITIEDQDRLIDTEQTWMTGFDDAIYDHVFGDPFLNSSIHKLGLAACGDEYEDKTVPPYCRTSVDAAELHLVAGLQGLKKYVSGYHAASESLYGGRNV